MDIKYDFINGTFQLINNLPVNFTSDGQIEEFTFLDINLLQFVRDFKMNISGENHSSSLTADIRFSRNGKNWTYWTTLMETTIEQPPFDPASKHIISIRVVRKGSGNNIITLNNFVLNGRIDRKIVDGESTVHVDGNEQVIKPPFIYKVFSISDLEILSSNNNDLDIKYRYSQTYGRTVSEWEPLTKENITTAKINPIRFFQIEYLVKSKSGGHISIYDINLIGEFQNVSKDYNKTNLYGVRENCSCLILCMIDGVSGNGTGTGSGSGTSNGSGNNNGGNFEQYYCDDSASSTMTPLTEEEAASLFDPYDQTKTLDLLNKMSSDAALQFGHEVVYFVTDPDSNGIDHTFHEYQLYNYICDGKIKVLVDNNQFPDDQITMNQFDLSLFENFEVQIIKTHFKTAFGIEKRPSKEDFLWFCKLNRMYQVEHVQSFRSFNNYSIYYKVILKKFNLKSNIKPGNELIKEKIAQLTNNQTLSELFGVDMINDKKEVANKKQQKTLTIEPIRNDIFVDIDREDILNGSVTIAKTVYDMDSSSGSDGVIYKNINRYIPVSSNLSYTSWFNVKRFKLLNNTPINNNLFSFYDEYNSIGIDISLLDNVLVTKLNGNTYTQTVTPSLDVNVWYAMVFNLNNRQRKIEAFIYKRNVELEEDAEFLNSSKLKLLWSNTIDINIESMELSDNIDPKIKSSNMKMTNIRLFSDVIKESVHNKILNQNIIRNDADYLLLADNANKQLILPNFNLNRDDDDKPNQY